MSLVIPILFILAIGYAVFKRVSLYECFLEGVKDAMNFTISLLPCIATVLIMCELFEKSGLSAWLCQTLSPAFSALGIPKELSKLVLIKPFSGSASLTLLEEIVNNYGADSYIARCAAVCYGSSETVFYVSAVYFAKSKPNKMGIIISIILLSSFVSTIFACLLCKFM